MSDVEIERKFLVQEMPDLDAARKSVIRQGYLTQPQDSVEIRLRQVDEAFLLTLKSGDGVVRIEKEVALGAEQFDRLWPDTEGRRVEKERWTGDLGGGLSFELDLFGGALAPLRLVEVEFSAEDQATAFRPPDWFGAEVTTDTRYKNKALALHGLPPGAV